MNTSKEGLTLKKRIALEIYSAKRCIETFTHDLRYLFWEATVRCNLNCSHCGSDCKASASIPDMPLKDFLMVLDNIAQKKDPRKIIVCITGGEPLLREDLITAGKEISSRKFPWGMVTNGMLMTDSKFSGLLASGISSMTISLDGNEADHNWFRGDPNSYKKAINAIKLAVKANNHRSGFNFDVLSCVNQRTIHHLAELKKRLIDLGVQRWRIATIFPKGRAANNKELLLANDQMRFLMDFIKQTRSEGFIKASFSCEGFLGEYEMEVRETPFYCQAGIGIGSVLVDGSISACPSLRSDYIQGSIYKSPFLEVWENKFSIMRNRSWAKTEECGTCRSWRYCQGNGLHLRDEKSGRLLYCNLKSVYGGQQKELHLEKRG